MNEIIIKTYVNFLHLGWGELLGIENVYLFYNLDQQLMDLLALDLIRKNLILSKHFIKWWKLTSL